MHAFLSSLLLMVNQGAAAAWMLNGLCQCLNTGIVPGNRNADNIDPTLRKFEHIVSIPLLFYML